jgi:hypothetical protein
MGYRACQRFYDERTVPQRAAHHSPLFDMTRNTRLISAIRFFATAPWRNHADPARLTRIGTVPAPAASHCACLLAVALAVGLTCARPTHAGQPPSARAVSTAPGDPFVATVPGQGSAQQKKKKAKTRTAKAPSAAQQGASGESTAQRDARLKRECKGRPNAGACLGYTAP